MPDYELKARVTIVGWENITADSKEEAIKHFEDRIGEEFTFKAPLLNKYLEISVELDEGFKDD